MGEEGDDGEDGEVDNVRFEEKDAGAEKEGYMYINARACSV